MAGELTAKEKVVGLKQTRRAVTQGTARQVYLACDADPALTEPLLALCRETMQQLGRVCGIAVAAAAVAIVAQ